MRGGWQGGSGPRRQRREPTGQRLRLGMLWECGDPFSRNGGQMPSPRSPELLSVFQKTNEKIRHHTLNTLPLGLHLACNEDSEIKSKDKIFVFFTFGKWAWEVVAKAVKGEKCGLNLSF